MVCGTVEKKHPNDAKRLAHAQDVPRFGQNSEVFDKQPVSVF